MLNKAQLFLPFYWLSLHVCVPTLELYAELFVYITQFFAFDDDTRPLGLYGNCVGVMHKLLGCSSRRDSQDRRILLYKTLNIHDPSRGSRCTNYFMPTDMNKYHLNIKAGHRILISVFYHINDVH